MRYKSIDLQQIQTIGLESSTCQKLRPVINAL